MLRDCAGESRVERLYAEHRGFVRQVLRAHGVTPASLDDGVQDVFLVAFRRIGDFVPRASHRSWLYGIAARVAKDHRRRSSRKGGLLELDVEDVACPRNDPCRTAVTAQALHGLYWRLGRMQEARRRIFILAEVEEMTAPEIAERLSVKLNTVYSRLRAARREFRVADPSRAQRVSAGA
jgi:RNA polymerase sigma-70 factor (ECF subfamily)